MCPPFVRPKLELFELCSQSFVKFACVIIILSLQVLFTDKLNAQQEFEARLYAGASYYLGDLAPLTNNFSSSQGEFALGTSIGWKFDDVFTLNLKYLYGKLSGSDKDSRDVFRRRRNLDFHSTLSELGLSLDIYLTTVVPNLQKFGIEVYINTGFNLFWFNPKTEYNGEIIELQPLGTEGQGTSFNGRPNKYKLMQPSFALGVGMDFELSERVKIGFEVVPRITWTDYIDDVSGFYVDTDLQMQEQGTLTALLANRQGEYLFGQGSGEIIEVKSDQLRGDPKFNDWYLMTLSYISYKFGGN